MNAPRDERVPPILFLVFNRPDTTARVFETIRAARPTQLFVAADGPRPDREGEAERCREVREITSAVDWPCTVTTLLREENLGCKRAVSSAIDWFFEQVPEGVILEDDVLPDPSFFRYVGELLDRYRDDPRVMMVSGDNFIASHWQPETSYYFSAFTHIWGWASWRSRWAHYDVEMQDWAAQRDAGLLERVFPGSPRKQRHWAALFDRVASNGIDTWDYQWAYTAFRLGGLSCMPAINLISNIGFGADATHTLDPEGKLADLPSGQLRFPLVHPREVAPDRSADEWTARHVFNIGPDREVGAGPSPRRSGRGRVPRAIASRLRRLRNAVASRLPSS